MIKLTFLGTGTSQGVPMIGCGCEVCSSADPRDGRLRSSVMVEYFDDAEPVAETSEVDSHADFDQTAEPLVRLVIDSGPDFRTQMLREGIRWVDAILLTHEHKDHIAGLDDVRAFNYFQQKPTPIYVTERVGRVVMKDFDYAFAEPRYPGAPEIELHTITPGEDFRVAGLDITPIAGTHYRLPVTGFRIGGIAYLTDFNAISDSELRKLDGIDTLVINALRWTEHVSHYTVAEAVEVARRVGARRTYITHMSHQIGLHEGLAARLPYGIIPAYDGLTVYSELPAQVRKTTER